MSRRVLDGGQGACARCRERRSRSGHAGPGYEMHIWTHQRRRCAAPDGFASRRASRTARSVADGRVMGSYVHGLFAERRIPARFPRAPRRERRARASPTTRRSSQTLDELADHLEAPSRPSTGSWLCSRSSADRESRAAASALRRSRRRRTAAASSGCPGACSVLSAAVVHPGVLDRLAVRRRAGPRCARPSAPAIAASGQPAFGERCCVRVAQHDAPGAAGSTPRTIGGRGARSGRRTGAPGRDSADRRAAPPPSRNAR